MVQCSATPGAAGHAVSLYDRGIICPAEMWFQIVRMLAPGSVAATLNILPADTQQQLRAVFVDRPSLPGGTEFAGIVAEVVGWWQGDRADPGPATQSSAPS